MGNAFNILSPYFLQQSAACKRHTASFLELVSMLLTYTILDGVLIPQLLYCTSLCRYIAVLFKEARSTYVKTARCLSWSWFSSVYWSVLTDSYVFTCNETVVVLFAEPGYVYTRITCVLLHFLSIIHRKERLVLTCVLAL